MQSKAHRSTRMPRFSLRVTYGTVRGYKEGSTELSPITLLGGAFDRHTGREPFVLPPSWLAAKGVQGVHLLNFVSTLDIIGGNSGSPVLNRDAQVVGTIFDGNIPSLGGAFSMTTQPTEPSRSTPRACSRCCAGL